MRAMVWVALALVGCANGGSDGPSGDAIELEVDCDGGSASSELWIALGDTVYEFPADMTGAVADPNGVDAAESRMSVGGSVTGESPRTRSASVAWVGDLTSGGTFSCADLGVTVSFDDGGASGLIYGADMVRTESSCTIEVTDSGDAVDDEVRGTFSGTLVGFNAPGSAEVCGGFNTVVIDTI